MVHIKKMNVLMISYLIQNMEISEISCMSKDEIILNCPSCFQEEFFSN